MKGIFCETFGQTPRNQIIEFFLEMRNTDYGIADIARNLEMNKATAYNTANELIKQKILVPKRTIGKTQTYVLNKQDIRVKTMMKTFDAMLKQIVEDETEQEITV